jgi:hypothetical protein
VEKEHDMKQRRGFPIFALVVAAVCVSIVSGVVSAQGPSGAAFERVKEVQEQHTERMLAKPGVAGTAVGLDDSGRYVVLILLENGAVPDIPADLDGVPVRRMVTGAIYALGKPSASAKPKAPTGLSATAQSSSQIHLAWKDNANNETGFKIERRTGADPFALVATVGANTTSYSDVGLSPSTAYTYRVCAYNAANTSRYSNEASATTQSAPGTVPAAPSGLAATAVGSTRIDLAWTDNADNETGFKIERAPDSVSFAEIATAGANATTYSDSSFPAPTAPTTYTYRVRAYNGTGDSGYSNTATATVDAAPEPTIDPTDRFPRPVPIGVSTGHPSITAGTIGCRVSIGGTLYALSNNHVYAASNTATLGDAVIQPGDYDGGTSPADDIGTLAAFKRIEWSVWPFIVFNDIDAAVAEIAVNSGVPAVGNATPSDGYGKPSSTTAAAFVGQPVKKYGRTTGLTHGTVQGVNVIIGVNYGSGKVAYFTGQIMIEPADFSAGGDSGSLIVTDDAACQPVGLLFAGSATQTYANPIDPVLAEFGATVDDQ